MGKKLELLAPAGDREKFMIALEYGADAVYFGGGPFSLRAAGDEFSPDDIRDCVAYAHANGKKAYLTLNVYAHDEDFGPLRAYLESIRGIPVDAFLVSDLGVLSLIREVLPDARFHASTQANVTNLRAAKAWADLGAERIVLARELSLEEIRTIRDGLPDEIELEAFVHGAMCISYSGRCLLSNFMAGRDANRGLCTHPCRWKYALVEEKRPGTYYPVEEDDRGTYFMNSNDLCMIGHIKDLADAGVTSLKIEGRMKSMYYVATTVRAYRMAIRDYENGTARDLTDELSKASHRRYTTGFYYGNPGRDDQNYEDSNYIRNYSFVGKVLSYDRETGIAVVQQRNKIVRGDEVEIIGPGEVRFRQTIEEMTDPETGLSLKEAPHPKQLLKIKMKNEVKRDYILQKPLNEESDPQ